MKRILLRIAWGLALLPTASSLASESPRSRSFDSAWRFLRGDAAGAEAQAFDDSAWRRLDVPHDWSIEDLPPKETAPPGTSPMPKDAGVKETRIGPFDPAESPSAHFTGNTVGGIGWYRKHFTANEPGRKVSVRFDGVYMNPEVWINGQRLGEHPHGYTGFEFDLTPYLKQDGQENVIAVRVRNEGRNSRWYSGSGIYRHVWLDVTDAVHVPSGGVFVTTPEVSKEQASVRVQTEVRNEGASDTDAVVRLRLIDPSGKEAGRGEMRLEKLHAGETRPVGQTLTVRSPELWSPDSPRLYAAEVEIVADGKTVDTVSTRFGIRTVSVDAEHGFRLNGETLKLKGCCIHHDNGPLGSAAIDRAEERKVGLLKAAGFNAIRTSHNPPSPALLDACDRLGMLVIVEAFDQWNRSKERNEQDYHRFFSEWSGRDVALLVKRDRNHPSVVMWSVGNEIPEQYTDGDTGKRLREAVLSLDPTRPVTQAISLDGRINKDWPRLSDPAFAHLDVAGYNYMPDKYEADHARHPERVMMGTESYPKEFFDYWSLVEKHPYVIGDFVWTGMDYLGEAGLGHSVLSNEKNSFFMPWPWIGAWCGDLDICGFKKPQSLYRDVVWRRSPIEITVHDPVPEGLHETVSGWGWPRESQSWNRQGQEGRPLQVSVYSRCDTVRLELNGKVVGTAPVSEATKLTARFDVPYAPGELRAYGLTGGKVVAQTAIRTTGTPKKLRMTPDRTAIRGNRNDLSYVTVEVVDENGRCVPDAEIPVHFSVTGAGELAAQGSGTPNDPASFRAPVRKTFRGRCLAILRPLGGAGDITLQATAEGLDPAEITVRCEGIPID